VFWASKRSGHHAVADWVRYQFKFPSLFFNDVPPGQSIQQHCGKYWINDRLISDWTEKYDENFQNVVCVNCESRMWDERSLALIRQSVDGLVKSYNELRVILVLRDPFNNLASLIKIGRVDLVPGFIELWKNHAELFLRQGQLSISAQTVEAIFDLNYNLWFSEATYRWVIRDALKVEQPMDFYDKVSQHGGGSSFDRLRLEDRPREMKVLERWKTITDHPMYRRMIDDADLARLCQQIYPVSFLDPILSLAGRSE
jgi:hypothetical protein